MQYICTCYLCEFIKILIEGYVTHHKSYSPMNFKLPNRSLSSNDKENMEVLYKYFYSICNYETTADWNFVNKIKYHYTFYKISSPMQICKLNTAIKRLQ